MAISFMVASMAKVAVKNCRVNTKVNTLNWNRECFTHVVAALEHSLHFLVHVMVIHGHEHGVHNDAQRDEELNEGIEDNKGDPFLKFQPNPAAVPHTKHIDALEDRLERLVFERGPILVVVLCWEIVNGD